MSERERGARPAVRLAVEGDPTRDAESVGAPLWRLDDERARLGGGSGAERRGRQIELAERLAADVERFAAQASEGGWLRLLDEIGGATTYSCWLAAEGLARSGAVGAIELEVKADLWRRAAARVAAEREATGVEVTPLLLRMLREHWGDGPVGPGLVIDDGWPGLRRWLAGASADEVAELLRLGWATPVATLARRVAPAIADGALVARLLDHTGESPDPRVMEDLLHNPALSPEATAMVATTLLTPLVGGAMMRLGPFGALERLAERGWDCPPALARRVEEGLDARLMSYDITLALAEMPALRQVPGIRQRLERVEDPFVWLAVARSESGEGQRALLSRLARHVVEHPDDWRGVGAVTEAVDLAEWGRLDRTLLAGLLAHPEREVRVAVQRVVGRNGGRGR